MSIQVRSKDRSDSKSPRSPLERKLWLLWQRLLRRLPSDAGASKSSAVAAADGLVRRGSAGGIASTEAIEHPPNVETRWGGDAADRHARWTHYVMRLVGVAISEAPSRRHHWTLRLRLREDVLPQCSLAIAVSPESLHLRFRSSDSQCLTLLSMRREVLGSALASLVGRTTEVDVVDDYFGHA